jgi:hypothetical protein
VSDGGELVSFILPARCDDTIVQVHVDDDGELTLLDYDLEEDMALEEMGYPPSDCLTLVREYGYESVSTLLGSETLLIPQELRVLLAIGIADRAIENFGTLHGKDVFSDSPEDREVLRDIILMSGNITRASQAQRLVDRARKAMEKAKNRRDTIEPEGLFRAAYRDLFIARAVLESMKALYAHLYGFPTLSGTPEETIPRYVKDTAHDTREAATQIGMAERNQQAFGNEYQWQHDYILGFLSDHLEDDE